IVLPRLEPGDENRELLQQVVRASERAAALTHQLLAYSRKQILQPKIVDLNELVGHAEKMLQRIIGEDVQLRVLTTQDLYRVRADPTQLEQVVLNLAANARDAMPTGGKLTIETANTHLAVGS